MKILITSSVISSFIFPVSAISPAWLYVVSQCVPVSPLLVSGQTPVSRVRAGQANTGKLSVSSCQIWKKMWHYCDTVTLWHCDLLIPRWVSNTILPSASTGSVPPLHGCKFYLTLISPSILLTPYTLHTLLWTI